MPPAVRVFHCDDSPAFRLLVREMLGELGGVEIVGEASTLEEALDVLPGAAADVVLVDLFAREREDELLRLLRGAAPGARLLLYTGMPEDRAPDGAERHVHKSVPFEELHRAITEVGRPPVSDRLDRYRDKRDFAATPEPAGEGGGAEGGARFVVQEHHATRLHWDLRLEHDGALASWAIPNGIPEDPQQNRKAVRTEDHPLEYLDFHGEIPAGSYGAGSMTIWDQRHLRDCTSGTSARSRSPSTASGCEAATGCSRPGRTRRTG